MHQCVRFSQSFGFGLNRVEKFVFGNRRQLQLTLMPSGFKQKSLPPLRNLRWRYCKAIQPAYSALIIKGSYWRWPERNLAGNAIDFHVQVLGMSSV